MSTLTTLRIHTLKNKGFEGTNPCELKGSTPSKEGPRILRVIAICSPLRPNFVRALASQRTGSVDGSSLSKRKTEITCNSNRLALLTKPSWSHPVFPSAQIAASPGIGHPAQEGLQGMVAYGYPMDPPLPSEKLGGEVETPTISGHVWIRSGML